MQEKKAKYLELVAKGAIDKAIMAIQADITPDSQLSKEITHISSNYFMTNPEYVTNRISFAEYQQFCSKISTSLISIIDKIEEHDLMPNVIKKNKDLEKQNEFDTKLFEEIAVSFQKESESIKNYLSLLSISSEKLSNTVEIVKADITTGLLKNNNQTNEYLDKIINTMDNNLKTISSILNSQENGLKGVQEELNSLDKVFRRLSGHLDIFQSQQIEILSSLREESNLNNAKLIGVIQALIKSIWETQKKESLGE